MEGFLDELVECSYQLVEVIDFALCLRKFRSPIAHEARTPPPRQPALDRHSPHSTSYRSSRPTRPRTALRKRSPAQHAPRPKLPAPALHKQPAHCAPISAFAQHTLPRHRTSPPLRASPSLGPCPPSPERGSAPPPPCRSPALPINLCATCPAVSICPHAAGAIAVRCIRSAAPDGTAATCSRATHTGAGFRVPRRPDARAHLSCAGSRAKAVHCWLVLQAV